MRRCPRAETRTAWSLGFARRSMLTFAVLLPGLKNPTSVVQCPLVVAYLVGECAEIRPLAASRSHRESPIFVVVRSIPAEVRRPCDAACPVRRSCHEQCDEVRPVAVAEAVDLVHVSFWIKLVPSLLAESVEVHPHVAGVLRVVHLRLVHEPEPEPDVAFLVAVVRVVDRTLDEQVGVAHCGGCGAAARRVLNVPQDGTEGESRAADEPGAAFVEEVLKCRPADRRPFGLLIIANCAAQAGAGTCLRIPTSGSFFARTTGHSGRRMRDSFDVPSARKA